MSDDLKITLTTSDSRIASPEYAYTFDPVLDTSTIDSGSISGMTVSMPDLTTTWTGQDNNWPSEYTVNEMILQYPALRIQYEKFLEVYNLVKDDYKNDIELLE